MEENKNNAVEKVEQTVSQLQNQAHGQQGNSQKMEDKRERLSRSTDLDNERIQKSIEKHKRKQEQRKIKEHKIAERQKLKASIKRDKAERKAQKGNGNQGNKDGKKGWIAAVVSLGLVALVLASVLTFNLLMPSAEEGMLQDIYNKSFYDTASSVNNIDVNLSKVLATTDGVAMQGYLTDIAVESELAENNIQQLPMHDEDRFYTAKVVNQIGDYAKYLNKKLANGESLTEQDQEILINLYQANLALKRAIQEVTSENKGQIDFSSMLKGDKNNALTQSFTRLQNLSVQYPELIYDGPFSDGQEDRDYKGISGNEITRAEAVSVVENAFAEYDIKSVEASGEVNGAIECYNITANTGKGALYAQVSKKGGRLLMFSLAGDCNAVEFTEEHVIGTANEFLERVGLLNMQPVWINLSGNVYTINFAYSIDGIPVYSDLAKVRVCAETDTVLGLEAVGYYTNHTERVISSPTISASKASEYVSDNIEIQTTRLAVIPIGNTSEKLCYEFMGDYDGSIYYVYIDAISGRQVQMFKVIESTEGKLLI